MLSHDSSHIVYLISLDSYLPSQSEFYQQIEDTAWGLVTTFILLMAGSAMAFWFIRKWAG